MSARLGMHDGVIRRNRTMERGLHDHLIRTAEARRRHAEAIANGVHRLWTAARRALERLINGTRRERPPAADGKDLPGTPGRASVADAVRRDWRPLARLFRRYVLEPYASRRRRRLAIAQLRALDDRLLADIGVTRGQIELAVDGLLASRGEGWARPSGRSLPTAAPQHALPRAA
jgi:uncharacterized protein YjiS (DUF1127 family)